MELYAKPIRIIINGASGTGKTTLAKELANHLGIFHMDLDDYYFHHDTELLCQKSCTRDVIIENVTNDISKHSNFIMSGTIGSILWNLVNPILSLAVLLIVPVEIRIERLYNREYSRYGKRILENGDMYCNYQKLINECKSYETGVHPAVPTTLERHERWIRELICPVIRLDGTKPIHDNVKKLIH